MKRIPAWKRLTPWTPEWFAYMRKENRKIRTTLENLLRRLGYAFDQGICEVEFYTNEARVLSSHLESTELGGRLIDIYERQMLGIASLEDNEEVPKLVEAMNKLQNDGQ